MNEKKLSGDALIFHEGGPGEAFARSCADAAAGYAAQAAAESCKQRRYEIARDAFVRFVANGAAAPDAAADAVYCADLLLKELAK